MGDLFGDILPKGDYQVGLYAGSVTSFFPVGCNIFCSKNIPSKPKFTGNNWQRVNIPAVDPILERVESSLDPAVGMQSNKQADPILADANVALPLDPLPNILLWSKKITGPVQDNPIQGPFWNLEQWTLNNASGGTATFSAEEEPDCTDWIGSCSGSLWGSYIFNITTVPHAYTVVKKGASWGYQPTSLLQGEATLVTTPKQVVTYRINPQAKWSDGQRITSHDFKYVWDQIVHGTDIYDTTGYAPFTAVVDPWTEKSVKFWSGGQSAHSIVAGVVEARKGLEKEHGKGAARADVRAFRAAQAAAVAKAAKGEFSSALEALAPGSAAAEKGPEPLKGLYRDARAAVVAAAEKALAAVEQRRVRDPAGAKRDLEDLVGRLGGTGLEEKAKALLAALG